MKEHLMEVCIMVPDEDNTLRPIPTTYWNSYEFSEFVLNQDSEVIIKRDGNKYIVIINKCHQ